MASIAVIGAGPAGLEAALQLAENNHSVTIIEQGLKAGGIPTGLNCKAGEKCRKCGLCLAAEKAYKISLVPGINLMTESKVVAAAYEDRRWHLGIESKRETRHLAVEAVIIATGVKTLASGFRPEFGYGRTSRVMTALEFEQMLSSSPDWENILGVLPRLAFIQCTGSREYTRGVSYCSRVCCLYTEKIAALILDRIAGSIVDIFYMDRQKYSPIYEAESARGIRYVRSMPARIDETARGSLLLRYENVEQSQVAESFYDWVVLSTALLPSEGTAEVCGILGVERDQNGFVKTLKGNVTNRPAVWAVGGCVRPVTVMESVVMARYTALQVHNSMLRPQFSA